jgi:hypothetical protein
VEILLSLQKYLSSSKAGFADAVVRLSRIPQFPAVMNAAEN